jgi:hypothetical protein
MMKCCKDVRLQGLTLLYCYTAGFQLSTVTFLLKSAFLKKVFHKQKIRLHLQPQRDGIIAQLVEQRTENPCVAGSIPADTTKSLQRNLGAFVF